MVEAKVATKLHPVALQWASVCNEWDWHRRGLPPSQPVAIRLQAEHVELEEAVCNKHLFALQSQPPRGESRHFGGQGDCLFTSSSPPVGLW